MARLVFFFALFVAAAFCFLGAPATSTLRAVASTEAVESSTASEDLKETLKDDLVEDLIVDQVLGGGKDGNEKVTEIMPLGALRSIKPGLNAISNIIDGVRVSIRNKRGDVKPVLYQGFVDIDDVLSQMQHTVGRAGVLGSVVRNAFSALRRSVSISINAVSQVRYMTTDVALEILLDFAIGALRDLSNSLDTVLM